MSIENKEFSRLIADLLGKTEVSYDVYRKARNALVLHINSKIKEARREERKRIIKVVNRYACVENILSAISCIPEEE